MNRLGSETNKDDDEASPRTKAKADAASSAALLSALVSQARELRSLTGSRVLRLPCCEGADGPDPELFLRAAAAPRRPCLLEGAARNASSFSRRPPWTEEQFVELSGGAGTVVTVAETPHGRADAVVPFDSDDDGEKEAGGGGKKSRKESRRRVFAQPREARMSLGELLRSLHAEAEADSSAPPPAVVRYAQRQNDSASDEFAALLESGAVPGRLAWAERAFADHISSSTPPNPSSPLAAPDAVNLWVGGPRSATSWHRDHYENVHFCLLGQKEFHLLPPSEGWRLQRKKWRAARYEEEGGGDGCRGKLVPVLESSPERQVRWSAAPPPPRSSSPGGDAAVDLPQEAFPWLCGSEARRTGLPPPLTVVVKAGDAIYLPPLWWHCVTQRGGGEEGSGNGSEGAAAAAAAARSSAPLSSSLPLPSPLRPPPPVTVCVNYWYDMRFEDRWCSARLADRLERALLRLGAAGGEDEEEEEEESSDDAGDEEEE